MNQVQIVQETGDGLVVISMFEPTGDWRPPSHWIQVASVVLPASEPVAGMALSMLEEMGGILEMNGDVPGWD